MSRIMYDFIWHDNTFTERKTGKDKYIKSIISVVSRRSQWSNSIVSFRTDCGDVVTSLFTMRKTVHFM